MLLSSYLTNSPTHSFCRGLRLARRGATRPRRGRPLAKLKIRPRESGQAERTAFLLACEHHLHDALELDLDELGEDFLGQGRAEFGVKRGGVERVLAIALMPLVRVPVG
jgi:hypothetical protein